MRLYVCYINIYIYIMPVCTCVRTYRYFKALFEASQRPKQWRIQDFGSEGSNFINSGQSRQYFATLGLRLDLEAVHKVRHARGGRGSEKV